MSSSSPSASPSPLRAALWTHAIPCALSAVAGAALLLVAQRRSASSQSRMLAEADAAHTARHGMTPSQFNLAAKQLVDQITEYRSTLRNRPVKSEVEPGYLRRLVPGEAPEEGEDWAAIQADIERVIMPGITHWSSPKFFAYFPAFASYPSLLGEMLCSGLNTIGFSWVGSPASTELETLCLDWVGKMCGLPKEYLHESNLGGGGCIQGTAAEAGAVALLAARSKALDGLAGSAAEDASRRLVAYISDHTHGIIAKGCKITGIPADRLRTLPTTEEDNFALQLRTVQEALNADVAAGRTPFFLCLTVGSTSSTAVDAVREIAEWVSTTYPRVWVHVDAAYAGAFSILPSRRALFSGLEHTDSFSFNPHKSMLVAFDCSLFFVRERRHLLSALSLANDGEYLRNAATESGRVLDLKDWQLPFGRRFRAAKLWFTLRAYGQQGVRRHLESAIENADRVKQHVRSDARFLLCCEPLHFGLVCFVCRFPAALSLKDSNALTESIKERANATGQIMMITTMLAGKTILRLSCNGESQQSLKDIDAAWQVVARVADEVWAEQGWSAPSLPLSSASSAAAAAFAVPVIDVSPLLVATPNPSARAQVAREIFQACTTSGFFYVKNHGVSEELQAELEAVSRRFFALPLEQKMAVRMSLGGLAWRGYFPVGDELTSGRPDQKEGLYLGVDHEESHPLVAARTPMHGRNLFPDSVLPELRPVVEAYIAAVTRLAHRIMEGIALSLGLDADYFASTLTKDPTVLFRIFNYPQQRGPRDEHSWGVGEHTDYGVLTILKQDHSGGLQVRTPQGGWINAPPIPGTFVCNIGDMLDRLTGGRFKSTPHRVRNVSANDRVSFPLFFDPAWTAEVHPIPLDHLALALIQEDQQQRWDRASVHTLTGTYGDYLLRKVGAVFPGLAGEVIQKKGY